MKVVVTSTGQDLSSAVDPRFGRARFFIVVDTDSGEFEVLDNEQNLNAAQGAGIQAARNVGETGAQAVVTGNIGPKAFAALSAMKVAIHTGASGTVAEAIEQFKAGGLEVAGGANVEGRWT